MNKLTSLDWNSAVEFDGSSLDCDPFASQVLVRAASAPDGHSLTIRDERFDREAIVPRHWHSDDPVATAWFNSLSASLPRGEAYFVATLREFRAAVPGSLAREIKAFCTQEVNHTREHLAFNRLVEDHGYNVVSIDKGIQEMLSLADGRSREFHLAVTLALEHFAAVIGRHLLSDPRYLDGADPVAAELWRWHATEEIEHKGISYDVWLHATRDWNRARRFAIRTLVALLITRKYFRNRVRDALGLMEQDGIPRWKGRFRLAWYLWGRPGMMRRMAREWAAILKPGFHPWHHDDRDLIRKWESPYADAVMPDGEPIEQRPAKAA
ncbi:metal-dependent hydrolase [Erythrobacter sp. JK5]|uniref:metal-dependent hydrolase n=1 Tax=Erythrobacter sp. JK5 TaxID=2829500 RepID=UPI001BAC58F5|nr:metal-dependent hydrolase [Erythrobacter sp. JK5]QUL39203.1 metal-dependent hydrolase [Erythrobacter sp. JK5]